MKTKTHGWVLMSVILALLAFVFIMALATFKAPTFFDETKEAKAAQLTATVGALVAQYKMEIGDYPKDLDALTKEEGQYGPWLREVPMDPFTNTTQIQYKKGKNSYAVYSVGKDGASSSDAETIGGDDIGFSGH